MKEKRRADRIKAVLVLSYDLFKGVRVRRRGVSEDISFTGIRIKIPKKYAQELSKEQTVGLEIEGLPKLESFFIGGKVVWIAPGPDENSSRVGITFVEMNDFQKDKLAKYLHGITK